MKREFDMFRKMHRSNPSAGFTILEAVIAIFVFSVGVLAILNMQISSIQANRKAKRMSEATAIASSMVSELRSIDYKSASLEGDSEEGAVYNMDDTGSYSRSYRVRRIAPLEGNAAVITITVSWLDKGKPYSIVNHYYKQDERK